MRELGFDRARYAPSQAEVVREVLAEVRKGDLVLTIGAGNVGKIADALLEALRAPSTVGRSRLG